MSAAIEHAMQFLLNGYHFTKGSQPEADDIRRKLIKEFPECWLHLHEVQPEAEGYRSSMKAILIDPQAQEIREVVVSKHLSGNNSITHAIHAQSVEYVKYAGQAITDGLAIDPEAIYKDDLNCFQINNTLCIGYGLLIGDNVEDYDDAKATVEEIKSRVSFKPRADHLDLQQSYKELYRLPSPMESLQGHFKPDAE